jgi:phosphoribosylformylglycinamidine cyclo-ligase
MAKTTYRDAGVDVAAKAGMLGSISEAVRSTFTDRVVGEPGAFAGMFRASFPGMADPVLVATNDGVGTKTKVASRAGRHRGIGADIVHHCVNDALVQGAEPLFFLDYFASARLDRAVFEEVIAGAAEACRALGIALLGGETAEMPGVYAEGEYDFAGFLVGAVDAPKAWPRDVALGDVLVGVASDGLHTNGFSLVNRLLEKGEMSLDAVPEGLGEPLADALLRPHRAYLRPMRTLRERLAVHAVSHITGGAFKKNLPRVLPKGLAAEVRLESWAPPPLFRFLAERAGLSGPEPYEFLNMGCGWVVVVAEADAPRAVVELQRLGERAWILGRVVRGDGVRFA